MLPRNFTSRILCLCPFSRCYHDIIHIFRRLVTLSLHISLSSSRFLQIRSLQKFFLFAGRCQSFAFSVSIVSVIIFLADKCFVGKQSSYFLVRFLHGTAGRFLSVASVDGGHQMVVLPVELTLLVLHSVTEQVQGFHELVHGLAAC